MKLMTQQVSTTAHEETPHAIQSTENNTLNLKSTISVVVKRRAQSLIKDKSLDAGTRGLIRYALEINDPCLPELVRRTDAGEVVSDTLDFSETTESIDDGPSQEKIEALAEMICRPGDEPATKSAALLVLMANLENARHPKAVANIAKHLAFNRCGDLNLCDMVDAEVRVLEVELLTGQLG